MNLTVKKNEGFPSLLTDFFSPTSLLGREFFDFDSDAWPTRLGVNMPTVNIKESPKDYRLELAAPGLERKDFIIEIDNNILSIKAEKEEEKKEEEGDYSRKEYSFNSFCRTFTLPENIKEDNIKAKYENGVLNLTIPKLKESPVKPAHKIDVS
ncbi:Hsp20/alpha crystallin family protein [Fulvivirga sp. 29W222]|uniref:Hsp20/alpha crystallin family protein n=1 Tax=Fulvivirga marina TaxID=2494733 RepID=A0A937G229_9BACT|nr:Hsp20/alpha crystallin family protein [Fulvivirga marina]MBL6448776.1 Hsp20/alpha crystallin family protein [Fulvivirga marina]